MSFNDQYAFNYVPVTWQFVRNRFSFQAKQLKKLTGLSSGESFDLMARAHGFSGWRGLANTLDALEAIERWLPDTYCFDDRPYSENCIHAMRIATSFAALNSSPSELAFGGRLVESFITKLPKPAADYDIIMEGQGNIFSEVREFILYLATWQGTFPVWSMDSLGVVLNAASQLRYLLPDQSSADTAAFTMYGTRAMPEDEIDDIYLSDSIELSNLDYQVDQCLANKPSTLPAELQLAYRHASELNFLSIGTWRTLLAAAEPRSLDSRLGGGPIPALLLTNATSDTVVQLGLHKFQPKENNFPLTGFYSDLDVLAPSNDAAARAAACSSRPPDALLLVTPEFIKSDKSLARFSPYLGYWLLRWDI